MGYIYTEFYLLCPVVFIFSVQPLVRSTGWPNIYDRRFWIIKCAVLLSCFSCFFFFFCLCPRSRLVILKWSNRSIVIYSQKNPIHLLDSARSINAQINLSIFWIQISTSFKSVKPCNLSVAKLYIFKIAKKCIK